MQFSLNDSIPVLERTPHVLRTLLDGLGVGQVTLAQLLASGRGESRRAHSRDYLTIPFGV